MPNITEDRPLDNIWLRGPHARGRMGAQTQRIWRNPDRKFLIGRLPPSCSLNVANEDGELSRPGHRN
eukprot:970602-Lingulodinium_polyedra.AAC.1